MANVRNRGWRDFWQMDRPESCMAANPATRQQIADWWQTCFRELENGARVLDVATGNGIVLRHAAAAAVDTGKRYSLVGIDLARIDPHRHLSDVPDDFRTVEFHGGVSTEKLPFDDESFDVVVSQYGLEYAALDEALAQVGRVLRPGGELRALCHSPDSEVVIQNLDDVEQVDLLLARGGVIESMQQLVKRIGAGARVNPALRKLSQALQKAEAFCRSRPRSDIVNEVCRGFADVANRWQAYSPHSLDLMVEDTRGKLLDHRLRIRDLRAAVITPERERVLLEILRTDPWQGGEIDALEVGERNSSVGFIVRAKRKRAADGVTAS